MKKNFSQPRQIIALLISLTLAVFNIGSTVSAQTADTYKSLQWPFYDPAFTVQTDPCSGTSYGGSVGDGSIDRFMRAVAKNESGGDPKAYNPAGPAYGKYQYITTTWQGATRSYYPPAIRYVNASDAPETVQDAVTFYRFAALANKYGGSVFKIAVVQYYLAAIDDPSLLDIVPGSGNSLTVREYANRIVDWYNNGDGADIPITYSQLPDFQSWLAKNGLENYPPLYAVRDDGSPVNNIPGTPPSQVTGCGGDPGQVNADGYAFPVGPQTKSAGYNLPCGRATCHWDGTPAADVIRAGVDGAPVYAISDGQIRNLRVYRGVTGCYSMQLQSSKDGYWYWYGHLQKPKIANNKFVKAGQQIAEVASTSLGSICHGREAGSAPQPHLHLDRGSPQGSPGGLECCRDPGSVPLVDKLWEGLPA